MRLEPPTSDSPYSAAKIGKRQHDSLYNVIQLYSYTMKILIDIDQQSDENFRQDPATTKNYSTIPNLGGPPL